MTASPGLTDKSPGEMVQFMDLTEKLVRIRRLDELADQVLPGIARLLGADGVFLYVGGANLREARFMQQGFNPETGCAIKKICAERFASGGAQSQPLPVTLDAPSGEAPSWCAVLYPLNSEQSSRGFLGMGYRQNTAVPCSEFQDRVPRLLAAATGRLVEQERCERQLSHLNMYWTVSSMLAQPIGLHEMLETALYCCLEVVSGSEASVLLLDDEKQNFSFYQIEGPAKPILTGATFPADKGIAASVLKMGRSEVINDVQNDPRFYGRIDADSGFQTRNMIAIPLIAGEEPVGVMEVLNKTDGSPFSEEEHRHLLSIADEVAFAVRNAKVFEYVVNSYCLQRQGQNSCKGCKRPLGSWTPCVKYREASL